MLYMSYINRYISTSKMYAEPQENTDSSYFILSIYSIIPCNFSHKFSLS